MGTANHRLVLTHYRAPHSHDIGQAEAHEQERLMQFQSGLAETEAQRFCQLTWSDILQCLPNPWPQWFHSFIAERRLEK
jgi:hypothetical protein